MEPVLKVATAVFAILGIVWVVAALRLRRKVLSESREYELWRRRHLAMALEQIESSEEDEILRGLHTVVALADQSTSAQALPKVIELKQSGSRFVARPAEAAYEKMRDALSGPPRRAASKR